MFKKSNQDALSPPQEMVLKRLGKWTFLFFAAKGMVWLLIAAAGVATFDF